MFAFAGLLMSGLLAAQTVLYSENFNGGTNSFTLNTTDLSSSSTNNSWVVNNNYTGGSASIVCFGFPFSFTIANTPNEPAGITGGPTSNYLHIRSTAGSASGINNANYQAADGFCTSDENYFAKMSNDISTTGKTNVTLKFWWMCMAEAGTEYGEVYYSTDGGNNWNLLTAPVSQYSGQASWTQQTITNAAFDNQASLRFGFRFVNTASSGSPGDPPFSIDDIEVSATAVSCLPSASSFSASACNSYTVPSGDETYSISGTYMDTIPNVAGCDSVMTIQLSILNSNSSFSATACNSYTVPSGTATYTVSGTYQDTITNAAGCDSIMTIQLTINNSSSASISASDCYSYTVPSGNATYYASGTYYDTIPNVAGCDSIITITFTLTPVDVSTTLSANGDSITANNTSATSYQWIDCNNGNAIIPGETGLSYGPAMNGSYAVIVNTGTCQDTSACVNIMTIGTKETTSSAGLRLYPNPAGESFSITLEQPSELLIKNMLGQTVLTKELKAGKQLIDIQEIQNGVYFVNVVQQNKKHTIKLIKE